MKNEFEKNCTVVNYKNNLFELLTQEQKESVEKNKVSLKFNKGETIFKQGAFAGQIMIVESGLVKICMEEGTHSLILKIVPKGNIAGLSSLSENSNIYQYSAIAYIDSIVQLIDINIFRAIIKKNHDFAAEIINILCANSIQTYGRFFCMTNKQSFGKMADVLMCMADNIFRNNEFELDISRKELAELSGMSTEAVIRTLKKLKDDDIIEIEGKIFRIKNIEKLKQISITG